MASLTVHTALSVCVHPLHCQRAWSVRSVSHQLCICVCWVRCVLHSIYSTCCICILSALSTSMESVFSLALYSIYSSTNNTLNKHIQKVLYIECECCVFERELSCSHCVALYKHFLECNKVRTVLHVGECALSLALSVCVCWVRCVSHSIYSTFCMCTSRALSLCMECALSLTNCLYVYIECIASRTLYTALSALHIQLSHELPVCVYWVHCDLHSLYALSALHIQLSHELSICV